MGVSLLSASVVTAPYIITMALTNFKPGRSTTAQRSWVMCWLVLGQIFAPSVTGLEFISEDGRLRRVLMAVLSACYYGMATIGGFVVVAKMVYSDQVCVRL